MKLRLSFLIVFVIIFQACSNNFSKESTTVDLPDTYDVHAKNYDPHEKFIPLPETLKKLTVPANEFIFNMDYKYRDKLLGVENDWNDLLKELIYYKNLDIKMLEKLITNEFINPNDNQNNSPTVRDIFHFMTKYPQVLAGGYIVGPTREDYRITIDELSVPKELVTKELIRDFGQFCKDADELSTINGLYSWWD